MSRPAVRIAIEMVLIALAAVPTVAVAQSLRCRNDLVNVGDSSESVQQKCGEPVDRRTRCVADPDQYQPGQVTGCREVEEWTYRPGYGQYVTTLRFEDGVLVKIVYGDRM